MLGEGLSPQARCGPFLNRRLRGCRRPGAVGEGELWREGEGAAH
jgi:hypothetical protein